MKVWEKLVKSGEKKTLKAVKKHGTAKRKTLSDYTRRTLGSGNMCEAVRLPPHENMNDWLAANTVDFFNEVSLLYGLIADEASEKYNKEGEGFPPGFEYRYVPSLPPPVSSPFAFVAPRECGALTHVLHTLYVSTQMANGREEADAGERRRVRGLRHDLGRGPD